MSDLPPGWAETKVEELLEKAFDGPFGSNLKSADYRSHGTQVVRLENIGRLRFRDELTTFVSDEKGLQLARHLIESGDVLFASFIDDPIRVCVAPVYLHRKAINKADCFALRASDAIMPEFLALQLATAAGAFAERVHGATRPRVGLRDVLQLRIALAPAAEQRRIVAKIDALTARSKRARAELHRVQELAVQSRSAALSVLSEESAGPDWEETSLGHLGAWGSGGTPNSRSPGFYGGDIPWIRSGDLPDGPITEHLMTLTEAGLTESAAKWVPAGAVLIAMYGATIGKLGIATYPVTTNQAVAYCRPSDRVDAQFLFWLLMQMKSHFIEAGQGGAQPNISQQLIKATPVSLPPLPEQRAIVARIEAAFARIAAVVREAERAAALLDRLHQALLAKAFRGELVPQDPADEPASTLLARLATARTAAPKPKRGRTSRR